MADGLTHECFHPVMGFVETEKSMDWHQKKPDVIIQNVPHVS